MSRNPYKRLWAVLEDHRTPEPQGTIAILYMVLFLFLPVITFIVLATWQPIIFLVPLIPATLVALVLGYRYAVRPVR